MNLQITCLPYALQIYTVNPARHSIQAMTPFIVHLLAYTRTSRSFFSFAKTPHEYSLVMDERQAQSLFRRYPNLVFEDASQGHDIEIWQALRLSTGGTFQQQVQILQRVAQALAQADISVFQISTYQTDYVLIPKSKTDVSIAALRAFSDVDVNGILLPCSSESALHNDSCTNDDDDVDSSTVERSSSSAVVKKHQHPLSTADIQLYLYELEKPRMLRYHFRALLDLFLYSKKETMFVSYTETEEEISLMSSNEAFYQYAQQQQRHQEQYGSVGIVLSPDIWRVIQVGNQKLGFSETGIVASQVHALSSAGTMLFYISTFSTDFVMIPIDDWPKARLILLEIFELLEGEFAALVEQQPVVDQDIEFDQCSEQKQHLVEDEDNNHPRIMHEIVH